MQNSKSSANGHTTSTSILSRDGAEVFYDIAAFLEDFHDAWERYLPVSSIPVESQPGMVAKGKPVPGGMLSSSGASSGRISLIDAAPGGPEEPEE